MKFLTAIQFLSTVFLTFVVGDEVTAAQPFRFAKFTIAASDILVPGACQDYNNKVANGVDVNHPNYCQSSNVQITFNGSPFDQYWQDVSAGSVPPPYHVTYSRLQRRGVCASTAGVEGIVEVSMKFPTSRLVWSGAASVGPACNAEWGRHIKLTQGSDLTDLNMATIKVQGLVSTLNSKAATHFKSCAEVAGPGVSVQREAFIGLAAAIKNFMSNDVNSAQTSWSPHEVLGQACRLRCNVCSSGWAGTITGQKTLKSGDTTYFTQTQTYYVGGTSSVNPNHVLADWTTAGSGTLTDATGTIKKWTMNADVAGQCDPMGNAACIKIVPSGGNITFSEANNPITAPNAYELTATPIGKATTTVSAPASEDGINGLNTPINTPAGSSSAQDHQLQTMNCQHPYQDSASPPLSCTLDWSWDLFKQ